MVLPKPSGPFLVGSCDIMTRVVTMPTDINCPFALLDGKVNMGTFARLYYPCDKDVETEKYDEVSALPKEQPVMYTKGMLTEINLTWLSGIVKFSLSEFLKHHYITLNTFFAHILSVLQIYFGKKYFRSIWLFFFNCLKF